MALETAANISQLNPSYPSGSDRLQQGDDHIRLIKQALKSTFPAITGQVTLSHTTINDLVNHLVPTGIIAPWYGTADAVPSGWALCDGSTVPRSDGSGNIVTPDLRGRTIVGATDARPANTKFGAEARAATTSDPAGDHTHSSSTAGAGGHDHGGKVGDTALSLSQIPSHTHDVACGTSEGDTSTNFTNGGSSLGAPVTTSAAGNGQAHTHSMTGVGDHVHTVTVVNAGTHAHGLPGFDVLQPSYSLHFIIKV